MYEWLWCDFQWPYLFWINSIPSIPIIHGFGKCSQVQSAGISRDKGRIEDEIQKPAAWMTAFSVRPAAEFTLGAFGDWSWDANVWWWKRASVFPFRGEEEEKGRLRGWMKERIWWCELFFSFWDKKSFSSLGILNGGCKEIDVCFLCGKKPNGSWRIQHLGLSRVKSPDGRKERKKERLRSNQLDWDLTEWDLLTWSCAGVCEEEIFGNVICKKSQIEQELKLNLAAMYDLTVRLLWGLVWSSCCLWAMSEGMGW